MGCDVGRSLGCCLQNSGLASNKCSAASKLPWSWRLPDSSY